MRNPNYRPLRPRLVLGTNGIWYEQSLFMDLDTPWYRHTVHLLLRDATSGQVAYETTAIFDGPWNDTLNLLPPMLGSRTAATTPCPARARWWWSYPAAATGAPLK